MAIPVILTINNRFCMPAGVLISSIVARAEATTCYQFLIVHQQRISARNQRRLRSIVEDTRHELAFIANAISYNGLKTNRRWTAEIYFKLDLPNLLPDLDRAIYLDADIVALSDLSDLYQFDLAGRSLGAYYTQIYNADLVNGESRPATNFNVGVLLLDLAALRQNRSMEEASQLLALNSEHFHTPEQTAMQITFHGDVTLLPEKFNQRLHALIAERRAFPLDTGLLHYTTKSKPWNTQGLPLRDLWLDSFRRSPFSRTRLINEFACSTDQEFKVHDRPFCKLVARFLNVSRS
ncbi:glycosyltransferase [Gammaproteobacteria bacterium]|nr:glycosyltransferase [Gammaproteobacteria bacterium]